MNKAFKLDKINIENIVDLTSLQEGILFHYLKDASKNLYFVQLSLEIQGAVKIDYFRNAWNKVVEDNEMLRTVYRWEKLNKPVQIILKEKNVDIRYYDLSKEEHILESEYQKIKRKDCEESFDLREVPFRLTLCKLSNDKYNLLISNHHIIYDGWSSGIILKEFFFNYFDSENEVLKVKLKTKYEEYLKYSRNSKLESFWGEYLQGLGRTQFLPLNAQYKSEKQNNFQVYTSIIPENEVKDILLFCNKNRVTVADIIYTAWGMLLSKYSDSYDIVFGTTVSGRNIPIRGIEQIVGLFINTIPLRIQFNKENTLIECLKHTSQQQKNRNKYENTPLINIVSSTDFKNDEELIESLVVIENYPLDREALKKTDTLNVNSFKIKESTNYKLTLSVLLGDEIEFHFNYLDTNFERIIVKKICTDLFFIINSIRENKAESLGNLDILSEDDKHKLLYEFNNIQKDFTKNKNIIKLFEEQCTRTPKNTALIFEDTKLSYLELDQRSNQIAHYLINRGSKVNSLVGIIADRSLDLMVGILGILKAGCGYLPIDIKSPNKRIEYILRDSCIDILLTQSKYSEFESFNLNVLYIDKHPGYSQSRPALKEKSLKSEIAYLIYTSGSTGLPKGVLVENSSVVNLLFFLNSKYSIEQQNTWLFKTPYIFDVSVSEIFGWILPGGSLSILPPEGEKNPELILHYISLHQVTHINFVPSMFGAFVNYINNETSNKLRTLRYILLAGEALKSEHIEVFTELASNIKLENLYGPTETTVFSSFHSINKDNISNNIPIGKGVSNTNLYVFNSSNQLQGIGIPGELHISGKGLSLGYLNQIELVHDRFIPNPYVDRDLLYKTGDLVRWLKNGTLEYLGRIDHQVKIRGNRIELGEIENALLKHSSILECAVMDREDKGDKYLCAYIVVEEEIEHETFRAYLSKQLPDYMVPSFFVELKALPLASSGKVNRKALPSPEVKAGRDYVAPSNKTEEKLVEVWSKVLEIEKKDISVTANFHSIGGHSLKATVLVSRIHKELEVRLELRDLFQYQTIHSQAEFINNSSRSTYVSIPQAQEKDFYTLSSSQRRLYLMQQLDLESNVYNMSGFIKVPDGKRKDEVETAFIKLIKRHENLRTCFKLNGEIPVQKICSDVKFIIKEDHIASNEILDFKNNFVKAFDLGVAPLLRVAYLEIIDGDNLLLVDMHHIISDARTLEILEEEFRQLLLGKELPQIYLHYKDYSEWQNSKEQQIRIKSQESYWIDKFAESLPVLNLPTDYNRPSIQNFEGAKVNFILSYDESEIIRRLCNDHGLTPYMCFLSIFTILLSKLSNQEDIAVGSPVAARLHADLDGVLGMFVNTIVMRNIVSGETQIDDYLRNIKKSTIEAFENQEYQFDDLVEQVVSERDISRNPLFDVMFNYLEGEFQAGQDSVWTELNHVTGVSKFDLSLTALDRGSELELIFEYSTKLFSSHNINKFIAYFKQLLKDLSGEQIKSLKELNILTQEDKQHLLYEFNNTQTDYLWNKAIHEIIEEQVVKNPNNISCVFDDEQISYTELNKKANRLAHYLKQKGVGKDSVVSLFLNPSLEMIISIIGVLKSGAVFLPINCDFPENRINYILLDSGSEIVIKNSMVSFRGLKDNVVIDIDTVLVREDYNDLSNLKNNFNSAYIIYTSGTTGKPKGVIASHKNILNYITWFQKSISLDKNDRAVLTTTYMFDAIYTLLFGVLFYGGRLSILAKNSYLNPISLIEYIDKENITLLKMTPTLFNTIINNVITKSSLSTVRFLMLGGESINTSDVEKFHKHNNKSIIMNHYGPTETTVGSITTIIDPDILSDYIKRSYIGKPINNTEIYILNESFQIQPVMVSGELFISGDGLTLGYLNNQELTQDKFIDHPFKEGERLYRTGDLTRWLPDGNIEFLGRIDHQVKIRGFRIEVGEIEHVLLMHENIKDCIVLALENNGDKYLCAYIVNKEEFDQEEIRTYLSSSLPDYMIPSYYMMLDKIPLTTNGKLNRKALPSPEIKAGDDYVAPSTETEEKLVEIWGEVLNIPKQEISVLANFFTLGGHSLKAMVLLGKIYKVTGVKFSLSDIFITSSIREQASYVNSCDNKNFTEILPVQQKDYYEASSLQKRIYIQQKLNPETISYNMMSVLILEGDLDLHRVNDAFLKIVERHEVFRTHFKLIDKEIMQVINSEVSIDNSYVVSCENEWEQEIENFIKLFDIEKAPLLRYKLVKIDENKHALLVDMHHIIADGVSNQILIRDFTKFYNKEILSELTIQYKDFAEWHNKLKNSEEYQKERIFWLKKFKGEIQMNEVPADFIRPQIRSIDSGDSIDFEIPENIVGKIDSIVNSLEGTTYMFLLAIFKILLSKLSDNEDIVVGTLVTGRIHPSLNNNVGMFVNTLALRNTISGKLSFRENFENIKRNTIESFDNQMFQLEDLIHELGLQRDTGRNPLFNYLFNMNNMDKEDFNISDIKVKNYTKSENNFSKFDLQLVAVRMDKVINLKLRYYNKLFKQATIEKYTTLYSDIIDQVLSNKDIIVNDISTTNSLTKITSTIETEREFNFEFD